MHLQKGRETESCWLGLRYRQFKASCLKQEGEVEGISCGEEEGVGAEEAGRGAEPFQGPIHEQYCESDADLRHSDSASAACGPLAQFRW